MQPNNLTLKYLPEGNEYFYSHNVLYVNLYYGFIHNYPKLETPKYPSNSEWINKL